MIEFTLSFLRRVPWVKGLIVVVLLCLMGLFFLMRNGKDADNLVTGKVDTGTVSHIISVSGTMDATRAAELAFVIPGVLEEIFVTEGKQVQAGDALASIEHDDLKADYKSVRASLMVALADQGELIEGITPEARAVAETNVEIARKNLERVTAEQTKLVDNAYRTLLSSGLEAVPEDKNGNYTAPTITGTYTCDPEGSYVLDIYRSGADSGYSFTLSGIESGGTYSVFTDAPSPFGTCGLLIQFTEGDRYANSKWTIEIPNKNSSAYLTNLNTYNLLNTQKNNAIEAATQQLSLAEQTLSLETATPRTESLSRAEAKVLQAQAQLEKVRAQIDDHILTAPFDGFITNVELVEGESVGTTPVITMISSEEFELTALIPEIDITKISVGQAAEIVFDAKANEILSGQISFISPLAKEIGGVSYFEAKLILLSEVDWLRSGLNADIDIILEERDNVLRLPKRFLMQENDSYYVQTLTGEMTQKKEVQVEFMGNDGYAEITGLNEGDTVVAP